uniref:Uncharacterized protein n=1 Tax=Leptospirillum ferrodiazotrophum TaxID=412449 RepID=C6HTU5_9BACT|nr:MAG: hypothetical protein UBAL3_44810011 [Leptospirillum ferrodiazotrophum]
MEHLNAKRSCATLILLLTVGLEGALLGLAGLIFCDLVLVAIDTRIFHAGSWTLPKIVLWVGALAFLLIYVLWVSESMRSNALALFHAGGKRCPKN